MPATSVCPDPDCGEAAPRADWARDTPACLLQGSPERACTAGVCSEQNRPQGQPRQAAARPGKRVTVSVWDAGPQGFLVQRMSCREPGRRRLQWWQRGGSGRRGRKQAPGTSGQGGDPGWVSGHIGETRACGRLRVCRQPVPCSEARPPRPGPPPGAQGTQYRKW